MYLTLEIAFTQHINSETRYCDREMWDFLAFKRIEIQKYLAIWATLLISYYVK